MSTSQRSNANNATTRLPPRRTAPQHTAPSRRTKRRGAQKITFGPNDHVRIGGPPLPGLEVEENKSNAVDSTPQQAVTQEVSSRKRKRDEDSVDGHSHKKRKVNGSNASNTNDKENESADSLPDGMMAGLAAMQTVLRRCWNEEKSKIGRAVTEQTQSAVKLQRENEALKERVKALKAELVTQHESHKETADKCARYEKEKQELNDTVSALRQQKERMEQKRKDDAIQSEKEVNGLKERIESLEKEIEEDRKQMKEKAERLKQLEDNVNVDQVQMSELQKTNEELRKKVECRETAHAKYLEMVRLLESVEEENRMATQVSGFEEVEEINAEIGSELKENEEARCELMNELERYLKMEDKYREVKKVLKAKKEENKKVKRERDNLARAQLQNDKKVLDYKSKMLEMEMAHKQKIIEKEKEMFAFRDRELVHKKEIEELHECVIIGESKGFRMKHENRNNDHESDDISIEDSDDDDDVSVESDKSRGALVSEANKTGL